MGKANTCGFGGASGNLIGAVKGPAYAASTARASSLVSSDQGPGLLHLSSPSRSLGRPPAPMKLRCCSVLPKNPIEKTDIEHVNFLFSSKSIGYWSLENRIFYTLKNQMNCRLKPNAHP
jgi:hypothetical protein